MHLNRGTTPAFPSLQEDTMKKTTHPERNGETLATAKHTAPKARLRTAVKAGGLLDESLPRMREPARDSDGNPLPDWWV